MLDCRRVPLLWTAYVLMPASSWGLLRGVPIGLGGAVVLFAVWWTWRYHHLLPSRSVLIVLLLVKLISGLFLSVERGLEADYFANTEWMPPIARSTDFRSRSFTRVDSRLNFGAPDGADFPLYFFDPPGRSTQPFSVVWRGFVRESRPEDRRAFYLKGSGVDGEFWVDGVQTVHLDPESGEAVDRARWPGGLRRLTVRLRVPPGAARRFEAGFIDAAGRRRPLDSSDLTARAYPSWRLSISRVITVVGTIVDTVLLLLLCGLFVLGVRRQVAAANAVALAWLGIMATGLAFTVPVVHRLAGFGEQRYSRVEQNARDLLLTGHSGTYSPMSYVVALSHVAFGEDLSGTYLLLWMIPAAIAVLLVPYTSVAMRVVNFLVPPEPE